MKTITGALFTSTAVCLAVPAFSQDLVREEAPKDERPPARASRSSNEPGESDGKTRFLRGMEEVLVTAQRREERLQDVPISISVVGGVELDKSTAQGMTETLSRVPGIATSLNAQTGGTLLSLRGVTAPTAFNAGSSPVGFYLDSVPFGFVRMATVPDPDVYDLNRVEVLRGPQGTLYGAGSQNGVVRIITNDADLNEFSLKARTALSHTQFGGDNVRADAAMNVPVVEGKLAARAVLGYKELSGWIDRPGNVDANDTRVRNGRFKLNGQPTERLSADLTAWISRSESTAPPTSANNRTYPLPDEPSIQDFDLYGLRLGYDFSTFTVTNSSSYIDYLSDADLDARILGINFDISTALGAKIFSNEVNLRSTNKGAWQWSVGGIFRDDDEHFFQRRSDVPAPQSVQFESASWATFGELTRLFLDGHLEITAGLRYFEDDLEMSEESRFGTAQPSQYISTQRNFYATTPRATVTWHFQKGAIVYGSYAEGFRSGFDQLPSVLAAAPSLGPVKPDLLKNYELGTKGSLWGGRANYDAAVYYIDWRDVQLPLVVIVDGVPRSAAVNASSASGIGADFALTTHLFEGFQLGMNFSWNDLQSDSDVLSGSVILLEKGDRLSMSAEYTVGAAADYAFQLGGSGLEGVFSLSANLTSELGSIGFIGGARQFIGGDRIGVSRASFGVASPDRWTATLFVDNLANEEGVVTSTPTPGPTREWNTYIRPRTYGLQIEYQL